MRRGPGGCKLLDTHERGSVKAERRKVFQMNEASHHTEISATHKVPMIAARS